VASQIDDVMPALKAIFGAPPATIEGFRDAWNQLMDRVVDGAGEAPDVRCDSVDVSGVPGTWITSRRSSNERTILFTHGGGYTCGSVHNYRDFVARLADTCGARVLGIDYRLAPEHPYPAGVEDTVTAYRWLLDQGVRPDRLVIVGDSAGGGITLTALIRIAAEGLATPAGAVSISAWLDFEANGASMDTNADKDPFNHRGVVLAVAEMYLAGQSARDASPLHATLTGLPPLLLQAAGDEVLVDDTRRMAERARDHGVTVVERIWDGLYHDFPLFDPAHENSVEAFEEINRFVREVTR
jgi:epsilon-lactone hydrolase